MQQILQQLSHSHHPIRGASWETFVLEDLLLERGGALHAVEIKTARAASPYLARGLRAIMQETGALSATIISTDSI
jgi:hypothetical protein